jgi:Spy/CpxP family protein refolding chaperone
MKRAVWMTALAWLSMVLPPAEAGARDDGAFQAGMVGVALLQDPIVQKELKLDEAQTAQAKALATKMRDRQNELFLKLEGLGGEVRTGKIHENSALLKEEATRALAEQLKPEQFARLGQIVLQQGGASTWLEPVIARSLEVTPEQSEKVKKILDREMILRREAQGNTRGNRRATTEKIQAIRKDTDAQAVELLTEPQKAAWKTLTGEPIDLGAGVLRGR